MAEQVDLGLDGGVDGLVPATGLSDPAPRSRTGVALAAGVAIAASAGLAWWVAAPQHSNAPAPPPAPAQAATAAPAAAQPLRYAPAEPDPGEVKRAYAEAQGVYTAGGPDALVRASTACAKATPADPQRLDYCLAFDVYAAEIAGGDAGDAASADWFGDSHARGLALARGALPDGVDAANRLGERRHLAQARRQGAPQGRADPAAGAPRAAAQRGPGAGSDTAASRGRAPARAAALIGRLSS